MSVQSLSLLRVVFTEAFPALPVLLYAYYSGPNFDMLGAARLKDVRKGFYVWEVLKNLSQNFGQLCIKVVRVAL